MLDGSLTRVSGAGIGRRIQPLEIGGTQCADVANCMCSQIAIRVMPYESRLEVDAGKSRSLVRKCRDFVVRQPKAQCHRLETRACLAQPVEARDVFTTDQSEVSEA